MSPPTGRSKAPTPIEERPELRDRLISIRKPTSGPLEANIQPSPGEGWMTTPGGLAQVVQFAASTFTVNSGKLLCWSKGTTVRGAGRGQTTLAKTNGAQIYAQLGVGPPSMLIYPIF
jgi:hypothetical protein